MNTPISPLFLSALSFTVLAVSIGFAQNTPSPKPGEKAPLVQGTDQDGKTLKLADLIGKKAVLLYFYPKDDTPGCTAEACGFRDQIDQLQKTNVQVIGVSFDSAESHRQFIAKHNLTFPLLADTDGRIADAYGARAAGKDRARRISFLIGLDGRIVHVTDSPKAEVHLAEMKEAALKLKS